MNTPETNVWIRNFVWRTFRDAADEDYLLARQSARLNLPYQFYWNGQQAIEKYLKCILVMNGISVAKIGHDLSDSFPILQNEIAGSLFPSVYCPPRYFRKSSFVRYHFEPYENIVLRFNEMGLAIQRYRTLGTDHPKDDLHKLDEIVFYLRRLCFPLELKIEDRRLSYREQLSKDPKMQPHPLFSFYYNARKETRREIFLSHSWRNFTFFENRALRNKKFFLGGIGFINSALNMSVKTKNPEHKAALRWALDNIRYPKSLRVAIELELAEQMT